MEHDPAAAPHPDFSEVATEPPAESLAHESELVEHIAHEHDFPDQPSEHPVDEQLAGVMDPEVLRAELP